MACKECETEFAPDIPAWEGPDMVTVEDNDTATVLYLPKGEVCALCAEDALLRALGMGWVLNAL